MCFIARTEFCVYKKTSEVQISLKSNYSASRFLLPKMGDARAHGPLQVQNCSVSMGQETLNTEIDERDCRGTINLRTREKFGLFWACVNCW